MHTYTDMDAYTLTYQTDETNTPIFLNTPSPNHFTYIKDLDLDMLCTHYPTVGGDVLGTLVTLH